jgi:hypothetical protein
MVVAGQLSGDALLLEEGPLMTMDPATVSGVKAGAAASSMEVAETCMAEHAQFFKLHIYAVLQHVTEAN